MDPVRILSSKILSDAVISSARKSGARAESCLMSLGLTLGSGAGIGAAVGKDDMNAAVRDPRFMEREELLRRAG